MKQLVVAGNPIGHSLSPVMHSAALETMDLDQEYRYDKMLLQKADLKKFIESIVSGSISGANVTLPFKTDVIPLLPNISETAAAVGAVNTIHREGSDVIGSNTDVQGFLNVLVENEVDLEGSRVTIIGAGGAARAVGFTVANEDISSLKILNRSELGAAKLAESIRKTSNVIIQSSTLGSFNDSKDEIDLLVNCTPIGMIGHSIARSPVNNNFISSDSVVMDLVYNPMRTQLLKDADNIGCKTIDGLEMLVHQGALSFETWIGLKPPLDVMRNSVLQFMEVKANGP